MTEPRRILHVDMDQFFAAIAVLDDPSLKGKPVLIGHDGPRGVVSTASYEARRFGCGSAMPMAVAKRRCPNAIVVSVPGKRIREMSHAVFEVFDRYSPLVQPLSCDEAFLDLTGSQRLLGPPIEAAQRLKQEIFETTKLTASVGLAPNKFLAKLASDMDKPDGLVVITPENLDRVLCPLPIGKLWGVGKVTCQKLEQAGYHKVKDLRDAGREALRRRLGDLGDHLHRIAWGLDDRPVTPDRVAKSIGHEQTFPADLQDPEEALAVLFGHAQDVASRLRRAQMLAKGVTLKLRFGDFQTITRAATLDRPTDVTDELWRAAKSVFHAWADRGYQPLRLAGVTATHLSPRGEAQSQAELFPDQNRQRNRQVDAAVDAITEKFGKAAVRRGGPTMRKKLNDRPNREGV